MTSEDDQRALFDSDRDVRVRGPSIEPAPVRPEHQALAAKLSKGIRLGSASWSFPGWIGLVYAAGSAAKHLASAGLTAYARHPLLRAAEIDRTYYDPLAAQALRAYADQVPEDFRFLVKAHEECTVRRFPAHARYGKKRGEANARYLDAAYAADAVVAQVVEGLGAKLGAIVFQFPPQEAGEPEAFAAELHGFLAGLPRGVPYAVEIRNAGLLTPSYAAALEDAGAVHCHNGWTAMPPIVAQARRIAPAARRPLVVRWLLRQGHAYEDAAQRYAPFDRIVAEDVAGRTALAGLVAKASLHDVPALIIVDNKAEGSAPESIARLAAALVAAGDS